MDTPTGPETSWGEGVKITDVRALRRYNAILRIALNIGSTAATLVAIGAICAYLWFVFKGNFENLIFTDGTNRTCVMDGGTGQIKDGNDSEKN
jgi:hypothetical protein